MQAGRRRKEGRITRCGIGPRITVRRFQLGLSRRELAEKLGVTERQVWRIENEKIWIIADEIPVIARALQTNVAALYGLGQLDPSGET